VEELPLHSQLVAASSVLEGIKDVCNYAKRINPVNLQSRGHIAAFVHPTKCMLCPEVLAAIMVFWQEV